MFHVDTHASYRLKGDRPRNGLAADADRAGVLARLDAGDERAICVGSLAPNRPSAINHARVGSERTSRLAAAFIAACLSVGIPFVAAFQIPRDAMSMAWCMSNSTSKPSELPVPPLPPLPLSRCWSACSSNKSALG